MSTQFLTNSNFGSFGVAPGDHLFVNKTGGIYNSSSNGCIVANQATITINGEALSSDIGLRLNSNNFTNIFSGFGGNTLNIGSTGTLNSHFGAVFAFGDTNTITNLGEISTTAGPGIQMSNYNDNGISRATNDGLISAHGGVGIEFGGGTFTNVTAIAANSGTIIAQGAGILTSGSALQLNNSGAITSTGFEGLKLGGASEVFNTGTISGITGIKVNTGDLDLANYGVVAAVTGGNAIHIISTTATATLINAGTLGGHIILNNGNDTLTNTGSIFGDINLGAGDDTFENAGGAVLGSVQGGLGDDTYILSGNAPALIENAAEGTDTVQSTASYTLAANFENLTLLQTNNATAIGNGEGNTLSGNNGDNWMRGLGGNDTIGGATGDDVLLGGAGNDKLYGGSSNDRLYGGSGDDRLFGGGDKDILQGDLGADVLFGGADADTFLFTRVNDSPKVGFDTIKDFETGTDAIDLSAFALSFIGTGAFSGAAELKFSVAGSNTNIWIDTNADSLADMRILVEGVTALTISDFIL